MQNMQLITCFPSFLFFFSPPKSRIQSDGLQPQGFSGDYLKQKDNIVSGRVMHERSRGGSEGADTPPLGKTLGAL